MPPSVDSVEFATVIHKPTPSRTTSSATFQTVPSDIESFHSLDYDDGSAGSKSLVLPDDGGSITPTQESRLPARSRSLNTLSNVRSAGPSQIDTADSIAPSGMMNRRRGVPRRGDSSAVFDMEPHEPCAAIRILRARSEQAGTFGGQDKGLTEAPGDVPSSNAIDSSPSGTVSQATESPQCPPNDLAVNVTGSSSRRNITATALDGPTGSPGHSATLTRRSWIPGGAFSMQTLRKKWHRSQVVTDKQSQSGALVQSRMSKTSKWIGRGKRSETMRRIMGKMKKKPENEGSTQSITLYEGT